MTTENSESEIKENWPEKSGKYRMSDFVCSPDFICRIAGLLVLVFSMLLLPGGCGGGGQEPDSISPSMPVFTKPNLIELEFRESPPLSHPNASDGKDYRNAEFTAHYGLKNISADEAYSRGYFGEGVTIAVADAGMDITHPDLAGKIEAPWHILNQNAMVSEADGEDIHGTYVAMLAAGARDNTDGIFQVTPTEGAPIPTKNIHGVAPGASIMPIVISDEGGVKSAQIVRYAIENGAQVINLSTGLGVFYYGRYPERDDGIWLTEPLPLFRPLLSLDILPDRSPLTAEFTQVANILENQDIVLVWAAGNESWNSLNGGTVNMCGTDFNEDGCQRGEIEISQQEFMENFLWIYDEHNPDNTISFKDMWGTDCGEDNCAEYNSSGEWREAPLFEPELLGKWVVAASSDKNGRISSFSNGCGAARNWCLVAPGEGLTVNPGDSRGLEGTSFAAPMVSGALAVLKSRFPDMSMEVIQAILLVSAEPVGDREKNSEEPDPVYGWGLLNLGNAIIKQDTVRLPYSVVPGMVGRTRAVSPGHYPHRPLMLPASVQRYAVSHRYRSLRKGQCVSPYEVIRRYRNQNRYSLGF